MRLPWPELKRHQFEQLCFDILRLVGFEQRSYVETGPHSKVGHDIIAYRVNDILPGAGYLERWLVAPVSFKPTPLMVEDVEPLKMWADEPKHEIDYLLIFTPAQISPALDEWILKFNRFPIKKYKIKHFLRHEIEHIVCSNRNLIDEYFSGFDPRELTKDEKNELIELVTRKLLNFRSDLGVIDIELHLLFYFEPEIQREIIEKIARLWKSDNFERLKRWNAGWVIIRTAKFKPELVPVEIVKEVAREGEEAYRAQAAHVLAWLAETSSEAVDPEFIGELLERSNDYFSQVPAVKALSSLISHDENSLNVIFEMLKSGDKNNQLTALRILIALADENPMLIPQSVGALVEKTTDTEVARLAGELKRKIQSFREAPLRAEFSRAMDEFEKKNYVRAQSLFESVARKAESEIKHEATWWSGYCFYLQRDYVYALKEFEKLVQAKNEFTVSGLWWVSLCYEKISKPEDSYRSLKELAALLDDSTFLQVSPDRRIGKEEIQALLFRRMKEIKEKI